MPDNNIVLLGFGGIHVFLKRFKVKPAFQGHEKTGVIFRRPEMAFTGILSAGKS
jgi:hypothetical protein